MGIHGNLGRRKSNVNGAGNPKLEKEKRPLDRLLKIIQNMDFLNIAETDCNFRKWFF